MLDSIIDKMYIKVDKRQLYVKNKLIENEHFMKGLGLPAQFSVKLKYIMCPPLEV